ncbi:adenosylcobinamide amidohydrolase [uncultured Hyphomicrobium sp.]|uniref:adenosylcobinamide amidohydrolase n=1 Tax=uncultured Hyphomicrobium sp. TaxID=194373 RepID=UPI0025DDC19E|nr:adenosylcobinamide amidohydrolase [uncultured Hyphomicrobium sp.]
MPPFALSCRPPYLVATFDTPQTMLSWSITQPGPRTARRVVWREVRNADLPPAEDPVVSIGRMLAESGFDDAVALVTSRDIRRYHLAQSCVEGVTATCVATVGLSNGERVGSRCSEPVWLPGTINILAHVSQPLSEAALIETVSLVTQARTVAIVEANVERAGAIVTGTGTDCIVVAAPEGEGRAPFAGMHTAVGEAVGDAVVRAVREGVSVWREDWEAATARRTSAAE